MYSQQKTAVACFVAKNCGVLAHEALLPLQFVPVSAAESADTLKPPCGHDANRTLNLEVQKERDVEYENEKIDNQRQASRRCSTHRRASSQDG